MDVLNRIIICFHNMQIEKCKIVKKIDPNFKE